MKLLRDCLSEKDEKARQFCLSIWGTFLKSLLELRLWKLAKLIQEGKLEVPIPPKPWLDLELMAKLLYYQKILKDPNPEPLDKVEFLKTIKEVLKDVLTDIDEELAMLQNKS